MKNINRILAFILVIVLNILSESLRFRIDMIKPFSVIISLLLLLNLVFAYFIKQKDYFVYAVSIVALVGLSSQLMFPGFAQCYLENIIVGLYLALFLAAFIPPLLKFKPFTFQISETKYPKAITKGNQFLKINLILNYCWAFIFFSSMILTKTKFSQDSSWQLILEITVPLVLQLAIGLPLTIKLPDYLMQKIKGDKLHFSSIKELFESMPLGLNKDRAEGIDIVVQFILTGEEAINTYLTIKNKKSYFTEGIAKQAALTIHSDSGLWLKISNKEISGDKAYLNNEYTIDGDMSILLDFHKLFSLDDNDDDEDELFENSKYDSKTVYKTFPKGKIKNIIVFDGGPRNKKFSKTTFITKQFCNGAEEAGANVEYIFLKDKHINNCLGCYHCWTKKPGLCVHKDDMPDLMLKYRKADLVVFASPLYIFSVTGIMKTFLDRLLPTMKPYMLIQDGYTIHPDRYPELDEHGFVVFSAAGFPEVKNNFDGMRGMYKMMNSHFENLHLMGEFYLTAAETIVQAIYRKRKEEVALSCYNAGKQLVEKGSINTCDMLALQNPGVSKKTFQMQADNFWESIEGKKSFLSTIPKLDY